MAKLDQIYRTLQEIAEFILKLLETGNYDVFILVTRKGYWGFKLAEKMYPERYKKATEGLLIFSDRYLMKCLDFKVFDNKRILIFDDSMTNGNSLFFYYALLLNKGAKKVTPASYALSTFYPAEDIKVLRRREFTRVVRDENLQSEKLQEMADEYANKFEEELQYCLRMTPENLGKLSINETCAFHENVIPMVVDLPMFSGRRDSQEISELVIKRDDWKKLCEGNSEWQHVSCDTEIGAKRYQLGFFQMTDHVLYTKFKNLFFNFIVRYKFKEINEEEIKLVFVPFVIVNSCRLSDVLSIFRTLFKGTSYFKAVYDVVAREVGSKELSLNTFLTDDIELVVKVLEKNHNMCRALYRSIIFDISNYIGMVFRRYVFEKTTIELEYDWEIMKDNFEDEFIQAMRQKCETFDEVAYMNHVFQCKNTEKIKPVDLENIPKSSEKANYIDVENFIREKIIRKKYDRSDNLRARMMTMETLCYETMQRFEFENEAQFRKILTSVILTMTENSSFGNDLFIDNDLDIMFRGFRAGENSELFQGEGVEWVYYYVLALFLMSKEKYREKYDRFALKLEQKFSEEGYIGKLISENAFHFYVNYFKEITQNERTEEQILNKWYLLDDQSYDNNDGRMKFRKYFCDCAFQDVYHWNM